MNLPATRPQETRRRVLGGLSLFGGPRTSLIPEAIPFQDPIEEIIRRASAAAAAVALLYRCRHVHSGDRRGNPS